MSVYAAQLLQILIGFLGALILCRGVIALQINDLPDGERKMQQAPVPSAGGLAIAVAGMIGWGAALIGLGTETLSAQTYAIILLALAGLILGLIDDMGFFGTKLKFAVLALISFLAASELFVFYPYWFVDAGDINVQFGYGPSVRHMWGIPNPILFFGSALWIFVLMNAVNFMDGSDGLMAGSVAVMLLGVVCVSLYFVGPSGIAMAPYLAIFAAIIGFLFWNLRGQLYAGDAGALFLGGMFAAFSLSLVRGGHVSVFTPATFSLPFLVDVILTVSWRARRGRNILQAHRDHAYQLFVRAGWVHWKVAALWWTGSLVCVAVGVLGFMMRGPFPAIAFSALTVLGIFAWRAQRNYYAPRLGL